tara:strand:+ start:497 stop:1441 length:945 start_codon:yes stop_codon:yes gene_type:complete
LRSIENALKQKFGKVPDHVHLLSYFSFLYSFCFRPYCSYILEDNSYTWNAPPQTRGKGLSASKTNIEHYITKGGYLYSNRVAKFLTEFEVVPKVTQRIETYFDQLLVDEVQDFAANDFNFLLALSAADTDCLFVGDFHQHTFDTSRDGAIRKTLHTKGLAHYLKQYSESGFELDTASLNKTYRCSPNVCEFITDKIGIAIKSHRTDETSVFVVDNKDQAIDLFHDESKVKLFFQEHAKYNCKSNNWGKAKGLNEYNDVCVVLNKTTQKAFREDNLAELPESTRNKLYVACSRTRGDLYLLDETHISHLKNKTIP